MAELRQVHENDTVTDLVQAVLERSGLYESVLAQDQAEGTGRAMNLDELVNATASYGNAAAGVAAYSWRTPAWPASARRRASRTPRPAPRRGRR